MLIIVNYFFTDFLNSINKLKKYRCLGFKAYLVPYEIKAYRSVKKSATCLRYPECIV
jgi:hypothetical protein